MHGRHGRWLCSRAVVQTHLLLATLVTSSLDPGLPLLLVMISHHIVVAILAPRTAADHAHGAPLPLGAAIGTGTGAMGEHLAPDGDWAVRAHGGGRAAVAMSLGCQG